MVAGIHASQDLATGPLDRVLRRHGATMIVRDGRWVAAHFGSPASETAVCLSTVGIADRSDRTTFEVRGSEPYIDAAITLLEPLGDRVAHVQTGPCTTIVRCERADEPACTAALLSADVAVEITERFATVEVVGPRAAELVRAIRLPGPERQPFVITRRADSYELLIEAEAGPALWSRLLDAGESLSVACVGLEALEHLAASRRSARSSSGRAPGGAGAASGRGAAGS